MEYVYEVRPRVLISEGLPSGRLWFGGPNAAGDAIRFVKFYGRASDVVIRVFGLDGKMIEEHQQKSALRDS